MTSSENEYVAPEFRTCPTCRISIAAIAEFWTDDAEFGDDYPGHAFWTIEQRFLALQKAVTDERARCLAHQNKEAGRCHR